VKKGRGGMEMTKEFQAKDSADHQKAGEEVRHADERVKEFCGPPR